MTYVHTSRVNHSSAHMCNNYSRKEAISYTTESAPAFRTTCCSLVSLEPHAITVAPSDLPSCTAASRPSGPPVAPSTSSTSPLYLSLLHQSVVGGVSSQAEAASLSEGERRRDGETVLISRPLRDTRRTAPNSAHCENRLGAMVTMTQGGSGSIRIQLPTLYQPPLRPARRERSLPAELAAGQ